MSDKSVGMDYSIGHVRMKYLDLANIHFTQGNWGGCRRDLENFLDTVDADSKSGKDIEKDFDKAHNNKDKVEKAIEKQVENLGYLERKDFEDNARGELEINILHDKKEICWRICLRDGLFNE